MGAGFWLKPRLRIAGERGGPQGGRGQPRSDPSGNTHTPHHAGILMLEKVAVHDEITHVIYLLRYEFHWHDWRKRALTHACADSDTWGWARGLRRLIDSCRVAPDPGGADVNPISFCDHEGIDVDMERVRPEPNGRVSVTRNLPVIDGVQFELELCS